MTWYLRLDCLPRPLQLLIAAPPPPPLDAAPASPGLYMRGSPCWQEQGFEFDQMYYRLELAWVS